MRLRCASYNIRLGIQRGVRAVADTIAAEAPDILAVQEVGRNWTMGPSGDTTAELASLLGLGHHLFVPSLAEDAAHYGHALLSRYPIEAAHWFTLARDTDEPRTLLDSHLRIDGHLVRCVSTHLSHVHDRPPQGRQLVERVGITTDATATVVLGDLNATDEELFIENLKSIARDADELGRPTYPANAPTRRIDYLLCRGGRWEDFAIGPNTDASDHRYVAATLVLD